jgi:hypothetical protein
LISLARCSTNLTLAFSKSIVGLTGIELGKNRIEYEECAKHYDGQDANGPELGGYVGMLYR